MAFASGINYRIQLINRYVVPGTNEQPSQAATVTVTVFVLLLFSTQLKYFSLYSSLG